MRFFYFAAAALLLAAAPRAHGQAGVLMDLEAGSPLGDRFRVDSSGAFVAYGFARDVGFSDGCFAQVPASGAGTRFMWYPCRGAVRFGRAGAANPSAWNDINIGDFSLAGGDNATAKGKAAFAYGEDLTVTSHAGSALGYGITVSGVAGFSAGLSNVCSGSACTALGYSTRAAGEGSVAMGYRTSAVGNYTVALGYRASSTASCTSHPGTPCTGTFAAGDASTTDSVRNQADNEFRIRYNGGIRLRVSTAANGNTPGAGGNVGCDLTVAVPSWTCASSRTLKENYLAVDGEYVLLQLRSVPVTTWSMIGADPGVRHLGPVAEDFYDAFGLGLGRTAIGLGDIDGVNLIAAQALEARTTRLQAQLDERTAQVRALQAHVDAQAQLLARMEARLRAVEAAP